MNLSLHADSVACGFATHQVGDSVVLHSVCIVYEMSRSLHPQVALSHPQPGSGRRKSVEVGPWNVGLQLYCEQHQSRKVGCVIYSRVVKENVPQSLDVSFTFTL